MSALSAVVDLADTVSSVLAQQTPEDPGGQGEDFGKASPIGLVVILLLFVSAILLVRSMNKRLRKLPESFEATNADRPDDEPSEDTPRR